MTYVLSLFVFHFSFFGASRRPDFVMYNKQYTLYILHECTYRRSLYLNDIVNYHVCILQVVAEISYL